MKSTHERKAQAIKSTPAKAGWELKLNSLRLASCRLCGTPRSLAGMLDPGKWMSFLPWPCPVKCMWGHKRGRDGWASLPPPLLPSRTWLPTDGFLWRAKKKELYFYVLINMRLILEGSVRWNEQNFPWLTVLAARLYRQRLSVYLLLLVLFLFQFSCSSVRKA